MKKEIYVPAILVVTIVLAALILRFEAFIIGTDLMVLNKLTGKTTIVSAKGVSTEVVGKAEVSAPKFDPMQLTTLESSASVSAKWRDGNLYYSFSVDEFSEVISKGLTSGQGVFNISFIDYDGFTIKEIPLSVNVLIKIIDDKGKGQGLSYKSSTPISYSDFRAIADWDISWSGFPESPSKK